MKEIEAKFYVDDLAVVRDRLLAQHGRRLKPKLLERNRRFDSADGRLRSARQVLRLRLDDQARLTFKRSLGTPEERLEIEFSVDDPEAAQAFLEALGFNAFASYEKRREQFDLGEVHVALDELPYGHFVEIEAPTLEDVRRVAGALGLDWERRVQINYLALFEELRRQFNLPFSDATFANFEALPSLRAEEIGLQDAIQAID